jgi:hypothetical protein
LCDDRHRKKQAARRRGHGSCHSARIFSLLEA